MNDEQFHILNLTGDVILYEFGQITRSNWYIIIMEYFLATRGPLPFSNLKQVLIQIDVIILKFSEYCNFKIFSGTLQLF